MKIIFYMEQYVGGGTDAVLANIFNNWPESTDEITYLTNRDNQGLALIKSMLYKSNVKIHLIDLKFIPHKIKWFSIDVLNKIMNNVISLLTYFTRIVSFYFILRKFNLEVVISNNGGYPAAYSCQSILISARLLGIKNTFLVVHHAAVPRRKRFLPFEIFMDFLTSQCVKNFVTVSEASKSILYKARRFPLNKIKVIHNGFDFHSDFAKIDIRRKYGLDSRNKLIGCVANLLPHKGHKVLINAYNISKIKNDSVLLIIGKKKEPVYSECLELVRELGIEDKVIFTGFIEGHPCEVIKALDLLVLPTLDFEGFGMVIGEAMFCGVPVVTTSVGAIPEIFRNKEHCLMVEPNNPFRLASAMDEIFQNPSSINEMIKRAKAYLIQNYSASLMAQKYRALASFA